MNEDFFIQAFKEQALRVIEQFRDEQQRKNEAMAHNMQQLAFGSSSAGSILSATATSNVSTVATTAATNVYATAGVASAHTYYKKEVANAALFMDDNLKISAFNVYTLCTDDSMYKFDDTSTISSRYAITEYFNVMYYDKLLTHGYKCGYKINDTKNVVKHLNFLTQTLENIVKHKSAFTIEKIASKWEKLHKALI